MSDHLARLAELSPVARRLCNSALLTERELDELEGMQVNRASVERARDFVTEGSPFTAAFAVRDGWAMRYRVTPEGKRQILSFVLPGDFVGLHTNYERHAAYSVQAVTEVELALIEPLRLMELYRSFPVLASGLDWLTVTTFNIVAEHVVSIGVRTAKERILHLLLELECRLLAVGLADDDGFSSPLTQAHIADSLGLTTVYVSRCLTAMRAEGLVDMRHGKVVFPDLERTLHSASFEPTFLERFRVRGRLPDSLMDDAVLALS